MHAVGCMPIQRQTKIDRLRQVSREKEVLHTHTHTHTNTRARAHTNTRKYTNTHTNTHTHTHTALVFIIVSNYLPIKTGNQTCFFRKQVHMLRQRINLNIGTIQQYNLLLLLWNLICIKTVCCLKQKYIYNTYCHLPVIQISGVQDPYTNKREMVTILHQVTTLI